MQYRSFGTTGKLVSQVGFGGMRFRDQKKVDDCVGLLHHAADAGINYFDTAPGYGDSEALMGRVIPELKRRTLEHPVYIATKSSQATPEGVRRDLENSLKRLQVDCIDFFHMWCVVTPEEYQRRKANGVLRELDRLKDEGMVRHVCLSTHMNGADIAEALRDYPFEGVLLGYSAINSAYRTQGVDEAAALGRAVVVMNPLGGGVIPRHAGRFGFLALRPSDSVVGGALRFLFDDARLNVILVGFSDRREVDEAVDAVDRFEPLSPDERQTIQHGLQESFDHMCTGCRYCEPCPQDIPVSRYLEAWNHRQLDGTMTEVLNRLRWHWGISAANHHLDNCTECGRCEEACTQRLPVLERLRAIREALVSEQS